MTIVATGSRPRRLGPSAARPDLAEIPGADLPCVYTSWDVLEGKLDGCRHVVVVDGCGYYQSSDPVEYLGVRVSAVASTAAFAEGLERNDRPAFSAAARQGAVRFYPSCLVTAIEAHAVQMLDILHGDRRAIEDVDAVVLSVGNEATDGIFTELSAAGHLVHRVGDCLAPRGIEHALFEAHRVARSL